MDKIVNLLRLLSDGGKIQHASLDILGIFFSDFSAR